MHSILLATDLAISITSYTCTGSMSVPALNSAHGMNAPAYSGSSMNDHVTYFLCPLVIICYEFTITFHHEYELFWIRRWTLVTLLYLANRYLMLASIIAKSMLGQALLQVTPVRGSMILSVPLRLTTLRFQICHISPFTFAYALNALLLGVGAIFTALRVFALLNRAYTISVLVLLLGLVPVALEFYGQYRAITDYVDDPDTSCLHELVVPSEVKFCGKKRAGRHRLFGPAMILTDRQSFLWLRCATYHHVKRAASLGIRVPMSTTLLKYGILYFILLCIANVSSLLIRLPSSYSDTNTIYGILAILPNVALSRFLINLRQLNYTEHNDAARLSQISTPSFRVPSLPSIGNLGEPLADGEEAIENEVGASGEICPDCANSQHSREDDDSSVPDHERDGEQSV
ncbi:hypothetical protein NM688_g3976 [Phlebia brevispora]|uniref:Uncharacterized protein n=1 Tax=Phlebia brevispora TaxID=194682 RepID=A0ACC1T3Y4_9APHY|nr:hypothetical protein NM688_g3976 [Phlebia brevispora]